MKRCNRPPLGWTCYLPRGHDGSSCPTWASWWNLRNIRHSRWLSRAAR